MNALINILLSLFGGGEKKQPKTPIAEKSEKPATKTDPTPSPAVPVARIEPEDPVPEPEPDKAKDEGDLPVWEGEINEEYLIPLEKGQAVIAGWYGGMGPKGVTWHWTATSTLKSCRRILGGADASRKGQASAQYGVGRSFEEGTDRYVALTNRSYHAGKGQNIRWDGKERDSKYESGVHTTVGSPWT